MADSKYANILESTFLHIRGITENKEKFLWDSGIVNLYQLKEKYFGCQMSLFEDVYNPTEETEKALHRNEIGFFLNKLPRKELYRAALTCYRDVMFLDIESTGLSRIYSYITLIGWVLNGEYKCFIKGETPELFFKDLAKAKVIVTFNGSLFDIPFIKKEFPDAKVPLAHIDLRFFTRRFGYSGGQKEIEKNLRIGRPENIKQINGKEAVSLWYKYLAGDLNSLELLLKYNFYDIIGMRQIFDKVIDYHIAKILPKYESPIYKFSSDQVDYEIKVTNDIYQKTKSYIKYYTINELFMNSNNCKDIKVIGIDLTGSEEKASGCSILQNNVAFTCMLKTDQELVDYVLENKPTIVSIDSPLSLPKGRKKVTDDDDGRNAFGIMRYCERELKKRGVNVYPSLIRSMQKLTERGIRLAQKLRSLGIPVIESFPGAAQDILKIPRKKTDLYFLKKGLLDFGLTGEFEQKNICHDELDAITSALVGLFFWQGRFEALGTEDEDYLIIPKLDEKEQVWGQRKVIGFSGPIATGKTTAANVLMGKGFHYVRFSQILGEMLKAEGKEINRSNLQEIGNRVNLEQGQYWLCKELVGKIPTDKNVVIDGLRHPEDHSFLSEYYGPDFVHIFVDTDVEIRRERYLLKPGSITEFNNAIEHPVEKNTYKLMNLANLVIQNNTQKTQFESALLNIEELI